MERAIVVGIQLKGTPDPAYLSSMDELKRLLETAGGQAVSVVTQERVRPDSALLVGEGKAAEIADLVRLKKASAVVFNDELSASQQKNLQELIPAKIIDRTRLILDIFAQRARTREGKLQVELAQMNYLLPRVTERFGRFEQQTGGIGTRGPGERKLDISQRRIRERIVRLGREIEGVRRQRDQQRDSRQRVPSGPGGHCGIHQRGQIHSPQYASNRPGPRRVGRRQTVRHTRPHHPPREVAGRPVGFVRRYGGFYSTSCPTRWWRRFTPPWKRPATPMCWYTSLTPRTPRGPTKKKWWKRFLKNWTPMGCRGWTCLTNRRPHFRPAGSCPTRRAVVGVGSCGRRVGPVFEPCGNDIGKRSKRTILRSSTRSAGPVGFALRRRADRVGKTRPPGHAVSRET
jgi:hypothetical protein